MNKAPLVSIIMASYNNGQYLNAAIESALSQSYDNLEIIIVDDGSTDGSIATLHSLEHHPRIRIDYNRQNRGVGFTKRKCVENATGEICAILDSDDALTEKAIESVVRVYNENPDAVMVVGGFEYYDERMEEPIRRKWFRFDIEEKSILEHGYAFGWDTFRKDAYEQAGGYDAGQTAEDQDLYFKMEEIGRVIFIEEYLYKYRQHDRGISKINNRLDVRYDHLRAVESAQERRRRNGDDRVMTEPELSKEWEDYYLRCCMYAFERRAYADSYRRLWKSFRVRPYGKLFLKLNLLVHPVKFWRRQTS